MGLDHSKIALPSIIPQQGEEKCGVERNTDHVDFFYRIQGINLCSSGPFITCSGPGLYMSPYHRHRKARGPG